MSRIGEIDSIDISGKKLLVRLDINSPIDPNTGSIIDDTRIRIHAETIKSLAKRNAALVLMSHQGRPGDRDFTDLSRHTELLSRHSGIHVKFVDDVIGPTARKEIAEIKPGEVILLDNVRFLSEELIEAPPEVHAKSYLVKKLAPLIDIYVNDAFATAHRSQASIVGFPPVVRSCAGPVMMREIKAIQRIVAEGANPKVFVLGGAKVLDSLRVIENLAKKRLADRILTAGLLGLVFQVAKGVKASSGVIQALERRGLLSLVPRAKKIIMEGAPVEVPIDYKVLKGDRDVVQEPSYSLTGVPLDIGDETVQMYSSIIKEAKLIVLRGPAGYVEDPRFAEGTKKLVDAALNSSAYVIIGGGHLTMFVHDYMFSSSERVHVSTGGGALLEFLSGSNLPGIDALMLSYKIFWEGKGV